MKKQPKGIKGMKRRRRDQQALTNLEIRKAMIAADQTIDRQGQELLAFRRIVISERAQVIYYAEKYRAMVAHQCFDLTAVGFLDLSEEQQEKFIKLAVIELNSDEAMVPHDAEAAKVEEPPATKGIIH